MGVQCLRPCHAFREGLPRLPTGALEGRPVATDAPDARMCMNFCLNFDPDGGREGGGRGRAL